MTKFLLLLFCKGGRRGWTYVWSTKFLSSYLNKVNEIPLKFGLDWTVQTEVIKPDSLSKILFKKNYPDYGFRIVWISVCRARVRLLDLLKPKLYSCTRVDLQKVEFNIFFCLFFYKRKYSQFLVLGQILLYNCMFL